MKYLLAYFIERYYLLITLQPNSMLLIKCCTLPGHLQLIIALYATIDWCMALIVTKSQLTIMRAGYKSTLCLT